MGKVETAAFDGTLVELLRLLREKGLILFALQPLPDESGRILSWRDVARCRYGMKKILLWYIFLSFLLIPAAVFARFEVLPRYKIQRERTDPSVILVGPSFVRRLGEFEHAQNFAKDAILPCETTKIIEQYCQPSDTILYGLCVINTSMTRYSTAHVSIPARKDLISWLWRRIVDPIPERYMSVTSKDQEIVDLALPPESFPALDREEAAGQLKWLSLRLQKQGVDLAFFVKLHKKHPNITFLIFPIADLASPEDADAFAKDIDLVIAAQEEFRDKLKAANIPAIYLPPLPSKEFIDICHYTGQGNAILRSKIEGIIVERPVQVVSSTSVN